MWNLANALTLSRFVFAPVMVALTLRLQGPETATLAWAAFVVLVVSFLTDMFDGLAARGLETVTDFGKIMDPVADSTFLMTTLFALVAADRFRVPVWLPLIVLYREIGMHVLRRYAALRGQVLAAKISGKVKLFLQALTISALYLLIAAADQGWLPDLSEAQLVERVTWGVGFIAFLSIASLPEYLREIPRLRGDASH